MAQNLNPLNNSRIALTYSSAPALSVKNVYFKRKFNQTYMLWAHQPLSSIVHFHCASLALVGIRVQEFERSAELLFQGQRCSGEELQVDVCWCTLSRNWGKPSHTWIPPPRTEVLSIDSAPYTWGTASTTNIVTASICSSETPRNGPKAVPQQTCCFSCIGVSFCFFRHIESEHLVLTDLGVCPPWSACCFTRERRRSHWSPDFLRLSYALHN